jgi:hypothetical protein
MMERKVEIAAIDPDFDGGSKPPVPDGIRWSMPYQSVAL